MPTLGGSLRLNQRAFLVNDHSLMLLGSWTQVYTAAKLLKMYSYSHLPACLNHAIIQLVVRCFRKYTYLTTCAITC